MTVSLPEWVEPMAATLTQERFTGPEWIFERKFDGIRLLAFKHGADVRLFSRNRLPQNTVPPSPRRSPSCRCTTSILDGEVTWGRAAGKVAYHVFDILWLDGRDVTSLPLDERRALLSALPLRPPLQRVAALDDPKPWERACREGWEGVIAKRRDSPYEHRRSPHWLKMKCEASQELVVGGFTDPQGGARRPRRAARRLLRGRRLRLRRQGRHRLRHEAAARAARAAGRARDRRRRRSPKPTGCRACARTGCGPRSSCRSRSSNGPVHGKLRHPRLLGVRTDKAGARGREGAAVITHPEKVLFPDDGITKGELAAYYEAIAPVMLPHIRGRPVTMERYPGGHRREGLLAEGRVEGLSRVAGARRGAEEGRHGAPSARHRHAIAALAGQPELHHAARLDVARAESVSARHLRLRSRSVARTSRTSLRAAALALRDLLDELGLPSWVKTSGSKGFHIVVPLDGKAGFGEVARFAHAVGDGPGRSAIRSTSRRSSARPIAAAASSSTPDATATARRSPRPTPCAPKPGAPVSAPCTWEEIERGDVGPRTFTLRDMAQRIADVGDLWADMAPQPLQAAVERLTR